jgi:YHS domain-containing protein
MLSEAKSRQKVSGRLLLIGMAIVCLVIIAGCNKSEPEKPVMSPTTETTTTTTPSATIKTDAPKVPHKITDAEVGTEAVCPVMGSKVKVTKDTLSAEYKGKVYYFCCGGCPDDFAKDPEKYIKK